MKPMGDRLDTLQYKVFQGAGLTMDERLERQGLIFDHTGRMPSRNDRQHGLPAASRRKAIRGTSARRSMQELSS